MNFIGVDLGTSSVKVALYTKEFELIEAVSETYEIIEPDNGWGEQDCETWISALDKSLLGLKDLHKEEMKKVRAIGLTGQMHGLVMLDTEGKVLRNAILWLDQRSHRECAELTDLLGYDYIIERTSNPISSGFTLSKLWWVKNNEREIYDKCDKILLPKDYIRYYLSGDFATDVSDASGMQMLNIKERSWDKDLLKKLDIPLSILPRVYESFEITGRIKENLKQRYGFDNDVFIGAGAGDNAAAAIGCGVIKDGDIFTTIGTSGVVFEHTHELKVDKEGRYHTFCAAVPNEWHIMGVTQAAGLSIEWLKKNFYKDIKNNLGKDHVYRQIERDLEETDIGASKLIYLPYLMGERSPHLDPFARGTLLGLSNIHGRKEIARAVFEGVAYSLRECLELMKKDDKVKDLEMTNKLNKEYGKQEKKKDDKNGFTTEIILTGGATENITFCKMIADIYGYDIGLLCKNSGTTLGAAILASVGAGVYKSIGEAVNIGVKKEAKVETNENRFAEYSKYYSVYKDIYINLKDIYKCLQKI